MVLIPQRAKLRTVLYRAYKQGRIITSIRHITDTSPSKTCLQGEVSDKGTVVLSKEYFALS
jgi:hypothetical protein